MFKKTRLVTLAALGLLGLSTAAWSQPAGWVYTSHGGYIASDSPYSTPAGVLHHTVSLSVRLNFVDSFKIGAGCTVANSVPALIMEVPTTFISVMDSLRNYVFVRFLVVGQKHEHSLYGELVGRNRISFAPFSKGQEQSLSILFAEMMRGKQLNIAILQGETTKPREYAINLSGFAEQGAKLLEVCQKYKRPDIEPTYFADYLTREPKEAAPKKFTLIPKKASQRQQTSEIVIEEKVVNKPAEKPEVIPFTPGGGPVSIGPDGKPIGVDSAKKAEASNISFGQAQGPMKIGVDGKPVPDSNVPSQPKSEEKKSSFDIF